jgi:hypothetical protein
LKIEGRMGIQNVRHRLAQFCLSWFRNIVVAGSKGPAYKGCQDTCRRVL